MYSVNFFQKDHGRYNFEILLKTVGKVNEGSNDVPFNNWRWPQKMFYSCCIHH